MDYVNTIKRGFAHTWNNKFMWVLGFLAALGSGSGFSNSNYSFNSGDMTGMETMLTPERIAALSAGLLAFGCIAFIVGIILWVVALSARGGLIGAVAQMEQGTGKPAFREAFRMGWRKIVPLVELTLILYLMPAILFAIITVGFIVTAGGMAFLAAGAEDPAAIGAGIGGLALVFLCLLCVILPFVIAVSLIYPFAFRGIVLRDMGVRDSIRHGWKTLKENLGEVLILAVAFFLVNILVLIVVAAIMVPVALAVGVPLVMLAESNATVITGILAVLGLVIGLVVFALVSAITTAWQSSTFTLGYLRWTGKNVSVAEA